MAGWPTREARIDKSRLKGFRAQHHPPRDFDTYIEVSTPFADGSQWCQRHQSPETVSRQHRFEALAGHASHPSSTRSIFEKTSGKNDRRPAASAGVNGPRKDG
jgi:hypothetical protein